jgi:diguanylate cyclase (GGDEF)-like protein
MSLDELDRHLDRLRGHGRAVGWAAIALGAGSGAAAWGWAIWLGPDALEKRDMASLAGFLAASGVVVFGLFAMGFRGWMHRLSRLQEELRQLAFHDPLTGARNRHQLDGHLAHLDDLMSDGHTVTMLVADLDHFKTVNDRYGHAAGDGVLREVAARIDAGLRRGDSLYRLGGEEFLIISTDIGSEGAFQLAERLRRSVAEHPMPGLPRDHKLTISIGVGASDKSPGADARSLLAIADAAMYQAKAAGRNCVR